MLSFSLSTKRWRHVIPTDSSAPSPRCDMAYARVGPKLFVHGGFDGLRILDEFWAFDLELLQWRSVRTAAGKRWGARVTNFTPGVR